MKNLIEKFSVFIILSVIFSAAACRSTANTALTNSSVNTPTANTPSDNTQKANNTSEYPFAPAAIAKTAFKMTDGKTFKLEEQQGNVILFNMWATWCGPCREEMPDLISLQDKYKDKNFKIIGLDADPKNESESEDEVKKFAEKMKLNYDLGWIEEDQMAEFLRISKFAGIPQTFLMDRQGRVRGVITGGGGGNMAKLRQIVDKVVNE